MSRRHRWIAILCLLLTVGLSGCTRDLVEVDNINLVVAFGVDQVENMVRVSAQIVLAQGAQGGAQQTQGPQALVAESTGNTVEQAMNKLNAQLPRQLFLPHNTIVVFGREYAEQGVSRVFDYLERNRSYRRNQLMVVTPGKAEDLLKASTPPEDITAMGLRQLVQQYAENSPIVMSQQLRVIREYLQASNSPILTALDLDEDHHPFVSGVGLFKGPNLVGFLNYDEAEGLLWLLGPTRDITVEAPCQEESGLSGIDVSSSSGDGNTSSDSGSSGGSSSGEGGTSSDSDSSNDNSSDIGSTFRVLSSTPVITPTFVNGQVIVHVKVRGKAELERACPNTKLSTETMDKLESQLNEQVKNSIRTTMKILQDKRVDAPQFGSVLFRNDPRSWRQYAAKWDDVFSDAQIQYDVRFHLLRSGLSANSPTEDYTREQLPPSSGRSAKVK